MAPGNNERHPGHTGTIPKTKARNNCNVPQEAVTPTRRDMTSNLVSTSLDWVPVSEYNSRSNHNQSRKPTNNTSDHELTDLDNSAVFESGFGRFVPVRPQPRVLPLNVQNRESINSEHHDDGTSSSISGHTLHPYAHQMQNGLNPHSNHAAAAVMIVNPTTPNAVTGNISQTYNAPNQNRNNLSRNLNAPRNNFEGNASNNNTPPISNSRGSTKTVNIMNNMFDQNQGSFNNANENNHIHRESARALGEAIVAACPDAAAVERRLGQIREYIRVTSSLVDTMRNSEDEAFIEHTKEEYDELVQMVMKLKESEKKLEEIVDKVPDNIEVPEVESELTIFEVPNTVTEVELKPDTNVVPAKSCNIVGEIEINSNLKKVTNIENEQLNKSAQISIADEVANQTDVVQATEVPIPENSSPSNDASETNSILEIKDIEPTPLINLQVDTVPEKNEPYLSDVLRKNIQSCVEKSAIIEELKYSSKESSDKEQDIVVRPMSVQSNGSAYSENELWQNEIKNKMELSQIRLATLKKQQKKLLKYQEEAKQQLEDMNRERQSQEIHPSTSHDNFAGMQNQPFNSGNYHQQNRMYAANQIGVATTLPHTSEPMQTQNVKYEHNLDNERGNSAHSSRNSQDDRYMQREPNVVINDETGGGRDSDAEEDEGLLSDRARMLQVKLRELQMRKQHMENLVTEFQKLQVATRAGVSHNTYSTSGEESADEEQTHKCNRSTNIKNEDPFKLMEIKAIKAALQKTKELTDLDLMRSVGNYEADQSPNTHEEPFQMQHSNIHDNKSSGGGSGWSTDGSVCRVRNSLRRKQPNRDHRPQSSNQQQQHNQQIQQQLQQQQLQQQQQQQLQQQQLQQQLQPHSSQHQPSSHETNISALQDLAQELRMETEKIMGERARIKDLVASKEVTRKQKKVNEEVRVPPQGPAERRQMELRAILAEKQRELEALLNKEKTITSAEGQNSNSRAASAVQSVNQSYVSEQEEPDSRSEQILIDSQNLRDADNYRGGGDNFVVRQASAGPSHISSAYASDSDNGARNKSNQRSRTRRRPTQDRPPEDNVQQVNMSQNVRHEPRIAEASNVSMVHPTTQTNDTASPLPYQHLPPPPVWTNNNKINQDMRTNQFTQNSHSQTMERLLGTPQMGFPPSMPFNMMMPYGMVGGCGCGCMCGAWGAWCWSQLAHTQRDLHALTQQIHHLEERWRSENASHTLNNQVPPGNRANNYWDNFRSYSRQNLLSANSKTNESQFAAAPAHNPHPLVERSHNSLHHTSSSTSPSLTPKRNTNVPSSSQNTQSLPNSNEEVPGRPRRNITYERSLSFSSAPDVLNLNQNSEEAPPAPPHHRYEDAANTSNALNVNVNRHDAHSNPFRNLNISNPIPEIIQSHANNLNTPANNKRKSSSKLPAKNSTNRRNCSLDYSQTSNINIASTSEMPNPNLASTSRGQNDKATSKLFDLLRENVYSEVTTLIDVNESHPDFLIQLFRELQGISSDALRQRVLQSIRNVSSQCSSGVESQNDENLGEETRPEPVTTSSENTNCHECDSLSNQVPCTNAQIDNQVIRFLLMKSEEIFSSELLEALASHILNSICENAQLNISQKQVVETLSKYKGLRVCDVSGDIIETIPVILSNTVSEDTIHLGSDSSVLQDVAGALNMFSSSDSQLHQMNGCPYDIWPGHHVHMDVDGANDNSARSSQDSKMDLINCSEMHNGDLAEADQTCPADVGDAAVNIHEDVGPNADALPDVVDTEEVTPTEAEAEWLGLDRVPTRLHMEQSSEK